MRLRRVLLTLGAVALLITVVPFLVLVFSSSPPPAQPPQKQQQQQQQQETHSSPPLTTPIKPLFRRETKVDRLPQGADVEKGVFLPACGAKGEPCLLDVWRDGERRLVFAARGHPLACTFKTDGTGDDDTTTSVNSATAQHHSTTLGVYVLSCVVPAEIDAGPGSKATVTILGRELPLPPLLTESRRFALSAVIMFRVFREDLFNVTFLELQEWLEAMFHMGVEHVYMYDNWVEPEEAQLHALAPYVAAGLVTYHHWPVKKPFGYPFSQQAAYTHCLYRYKAESEWMLQADVDEYPFVFGDTEPGYLLRIAQKTAAARPDVAQIHFQTVFFGPIETPLQPPKTCSPCEQRCNRPLLIERFQHRENPPRSSLRIKPLFRPSAMSHANVHRMAGSGANLELKFSQAWLLHYWGFRCKDCPFHDDVAQPLAAHVRARLRARDCGAPSTGN